MNSHRAISLSLYLTLFPWEKGMKESFSEGLEIRAKKEPAAHAFYHVLWIEAKAKVDKDSFKIAHELISSIQET